MATHLLVTYSPSLHVDADTVTIAISRKLINTMFVFIVSSIEVICVSDKYRWRSETIMWNLCVYMHVFNRNEFLHWYSHTRCEGVINMYCYTLVERQGNTVHCNRDRKEHQTTRGSFDTWYRLLDSLVVECWHRVREVPGSIPSQGPRHTKDVINMVPVVPLFSTQHWKGQYWLFLKN